VVVLDQEAQRSGDGIKIGDERAVDQLASAFEHLGEDGFRTDAVNPRWLVIDLGRSTGG